MLVHQSREAIRSPHGVSGPEGEIQGRAIFHSHLLWFPAEKCIQNIYQEFCLGQPRKYSGIMAELLLQAELPLDSIKANMTEFTAGGVDTVSVPQTGPNLGQGRRCSCTRGRGGALPLAELTCHFWQCPPPTSHNMA